MSAEINDLVSFDISQQCHMVMMSNNCTLAADQRAMGWTIEISLTFWMFFASYVNEFRLCKTSEEASISTDVLFRHHFLIKWACY